MNKKTKTNALIIIGLLIVVICSSCITQKESDLVTKPFILDQAKILLSMSREYDPLFLCSEPGNETIGIYDLKSNTFEEIRSSPEANYYGATWSPDNARIAYVESKITIYDPFGEEQPDPGETSVWIMDVKTNTHTRISPLYENQGEHIFPYCWPISRIYPYLNWSKDGRYLHYSVSVKDASGKLIINNHIINVEDGEEVFSGPTLEIGLIQFTNKQDVIVYIEDNILVFYNLRNEEEVERFSVVDEYVPLVFTPNNSSSANPIILTYEIDEKADTYRVKLLKKDNENEWLPYLSEPWSFLGGENESDSRFTAIQNETTLILYDVVSMEMWKVEDADADVISSAYLKTIEDRRTGKPFITYYVFDSYYKDAAGKVFGLMFNDAGYSIMELLNLNDLGYEYPIYLSGFDLEN